MKGITTSKISLIIPLMIIVCLVSFPAYAKYGGGTGEPNDPYQIATAEDLMLLGESPDDYGKQFILTEDIDLGIYTGTDLSIIGSRDFPFTGVFDGNGHTISNFNYTSTETDYVGLFRFIDGPNAQIINLGLVNPDIEAGIGAFVGSLVGRLKTGRIVGCYVEDGGVSGDFSVGGLVGLTLTGGTIINSYSNSNISGNENVGGLIGGNTGTVDGCYSTCNVTGTTNVGGLVGVNGEFFMGWSLIMGTISDCYSTGSTSGNEDVGGLVGSYYAGIITNCYATGKVLGNKKVGGLVGAEVFGLGEVEACFWDIETSGQTTSDGGIGKTTAEMQTASAFLEAGWDFSDETENGPNDVWKISEGLDYPRLSWEKYSGGTGDPNNPYRIATAEDLILLGESPEDYDKHFIMIDDIDLDPNLPGRKVFNKAVISPDVKPIEWDFQGTSFNGVFDGNGHIITNLTIRGWSYLGLFGELGYGATVTDLGLDGVYINGMGDYVGGLVGQTDLYWYNSFGSVSIINCYSTGTVSGKDFVGGLVGANNGNITSSYNTATVIGLDTIGGLVGENWGHITKSYSNGTVTGNEDIGGLVGINIGLVTASCVTSTITADFDVGGLVGRNLDTITNCYSLAHVEGKASVGGLVGRNGHVGPETVRPVRVYGTISKSYSAGIVVEMDSGGGLVGSHVGGEITNSFWVIQESGQTKSFGGKGLSTAEMQTATTFLEAGWDFVDETENGTEDIWWILEGQDYPRLWWERPTDDLFFLVVDDFESYNNLDPSEPNSNRLFDTWIDGYGTTTNGAVVGLVDRWSWPEWMPTHSGFQSMPFSYNNSVGKSEVTMTLISNQDWIENGVDTLTIWYIGNSSNAAETMYVVLNGRAVVTNDNPNAPLINQWTQWDIDLQAFADQSVNLANVNTITLGFGNRDNPQPGGSGLVYFDDIRLYRSAK